MENARQNLIQEHSPKKVSKDVVLDDKLFDNNEEHFHGGFNILKPDPANNSGERIPDDIQHKISELER